MKVSVITKTGKQAEITLTENNNRMSFVSLVTVDGKEIKGDWRLENNVVKNYTNKIAIELKEENLSQISVENLKIAKVSYSNRYLSIVSNDEGYFAVKEAMKNTCSSLSEVEQILGGKEMLVSELISKLESKLQDFNVIEAVETVVEFVAANYDEEQDGNFEKKEYKTTKKTLVKKVEIKEEIKEEIKDNKKKSVFIKMWSIIRETARKIDCKISEVSKSIALKMAYETPSNYEIEQNKQSIKLENYPTTMKKVFVGKGQVFGTERSVTFGKFDGEIRVFDVLYVEKSNDVYEYFWIDQDYQLVSLTKSHFGFKNTCIWETMQLNYERVVRLTDCWEDFFMKMEQNYNY